MMWRSLKSQHEIKVTPAHIKNNQTAAREIV